MLTFSGSFESLAENGFSFFLLFEAAHLYIL
jgi:hypothetical protein